MESLSKGIKERYVVPPLQGTVTLFEKGGAPGRVGGSSPSCGRQLLCGPGLGSPVLLGLDFVLSSEWRLSRLPRAAIHRGQPENRNLFLHKVTSGFETKEKEPFIAHFMTRLIS